MRSRGIKRKQITALSLGEKAVNLRNSFAAKRGSAIHSTFNDNLQSHDNIWIRKTNQSGLCSGVGQATQASGCRRRLISLYSSKDNELTARSVSLPRTACVCFLYNAFKYNQSTHLLHILSIAHFTEGAVIMKGCRKTGLCLIYSRGGTQEHEQNDRISREHDRISNRELPSTKQAANRNVQSNQVITDSHAEIRKFTTEWMTSLRMEVEPNSTGRIHLNSNAHTSSDCRETCFNILTGDKPVNCRLTIEMAHTSTDTRKNVK